MLKTEENGVTNIILDADPDQETPTDENSEENPSDGGDGSEAAESGDDESQEAENGADPSEVDADAGADAEGVAEDESDEEAKDDGSNKTDRHRVRGERKTNRRLRKAINRISAERTDALNRASELERENQRISAELAEIRAEKVALDAEEIDDLDDVAKALRDRDKKALDRREDSAKKKQQSNAQEKDQKLSQNIASSFSDARKVYNDFDAQVGSFTSNASALGAPGKAVARAASISRDPGGVIYHLAKNPDELQRIAALPSEIQAQEIGAIAISVAADGAKPKPKPKPKNPSEPAVTVGSGSGTPSGKLSLDQINKAVAEGRDPFG